jgi:hypothetical protein
MRIMDDRFSRGTDFNYQMNLEISAFLSPGDPFQVM